MNSRLAKTLTLGVLIVLIVVFSMQPLNAPIKDGLTLQNVLASLGGIFIIVLLVERVTEIIIALWRQSDAEQLKTEIEDLSKDTTKSAELLFKQKSLVKYQAETKYIALLVGFAVSVIVCCAGVGLMGTVIDINKGNANFLRGVDIFLTSGLIAGGSDSFHQFVSVFETFFIKSKKRIENKI